MIRFLAVLAALIAALAAAPTAFGAVPVTFTVNDNGDAADADTLTDPTCDSDGDTGNGVQCTLRSAIDQANATPGADIIQFAASGRAPVVLALLPQVTEQISIEGGGNTVVDFGGSPSARQLDIQAINSVVKAITLKNAHGTAVNLGRNGDRLDTVRIDATTGTAIRLGADSQRVDATHIQTGSGTGILAAGGLATISSPVISGLDGPGIDVTGNDVGVNAPDITNDRYGIRTSGVGATISNGRITGSLGAGVLNSGQNNTVTRVLMFGNADRAIANAPGANGGIAPPQSLRIGPRRADGSLPLTGNAGGNVELFAGDPNGPGPVAFADAFNAGGDFTYNFPSEPAPGTTFAATVTSGGLGTSEFATVTVPSDVFSPDVTFARALDTNNVRVEFNEPIDPGSIQPEDFKLSMAGADRQISSASAGPDGHSAILVSSGWKAGEAGAVEMTSAGAVTDTTGNATLSAPRLRVAAAPGDFLAPLASKLSVNKTICLTRGRKCKTPGMTIKFVTNEAGKARIVIKRSNQTVGSRLYGNIVVGKNTLKFNGRLSSRKLRAGRYRLLIYVQDQVGNVTDQPPIQLFTVRRVTK